MAERFVEKLEMGEKEKEIPLPYILMAEATSKLKEMAKTLRHIAEMVEEERRGADDVMELLKYLDYEKEIQEVIECSIKLQSAGDIIRKVAHKFEEIARRIVSK